jgi:L-ascorbate metabolism protein UlaG (beta-lactamase superfamily)
MELIWLGHGCFRLRTREATIITDPCPRSTGYSIGRPADIVTVSSNIPTILPERCGKLLVFGQRVQTQMH